MGEILSAAAVVGSLFYAIFEFRRTQTLTSRDVETILFERVQSANTLVIENPQLADIVVAAARSTDSLTAADQLRYLAFQHNFFDSWEIAWSYHADGILGNESWREWDDWFSREAQRRPAFAWNGNRHHFTGPEFLGHVDAILAGD